MNKYKAQIVLTIIMFSLMALTLDDKLSRVADNISASDFGIVISEKEYGISWPFKFDHVALMCPAENIVVVYHSDTATNYALTQIKRAFAYGWRDYHEILNPTASDAIIKSIIKRGMKIC